VLSADGATADELAEAARHTSRAMDLAPNSTRTPSRWPAAWPRRRTIAPCSTAAPRGLLELAPNAVTTQIYHTNLALAEGRPADAEAALEAAHANGLPEVPYLALSERVRAAMPFSVRATHFIRQRGAILGGSWASC
jgi:hypothetical protein